MKTNDQRNKYDRHKETANALAHQQLQNCALLCAYVYGSAPGWYAVVDCHIDGFRADYAMVHDNAGDFENHPVRAFYLIGNETESGALGELEEIRAAVKKTFAMDEPPLVEILTTEEKEAARLAVREALDEERPENAEAWLEHNAEAWLEALCDGPGNYLSGTDWSAVVEAVRK